MKVLSIDGGGVRGIIAARILQEIEERTKKLVAELFDIISGTSTGGLLALALTRPQQPRYGTPQFSAEELVSIYLEHSKDIFSKRTFLKELKTGFGLWGSKYDRTAYDSILAAMFNDSLLNQTIKPVFVPIYSLENNKPFISSTYFARKNSENNFYLKDIAAATSAAPTYFDPKVFKNLTGTTTYQGVDGGIYANNPELIGVTGAYIMHPDLEISQMILLSLGTGETIRNQHYYGNYGDIGWLKNQDIIGDMLDAESAIAETAITAMLKNNNHFRFQPIIPAELIDIDNSSDSNLQALLKAAEDYIVQNNSQIDDLCNKLVS